MAASHYIFGSHMQYFFTCHTQAVRELPLIKYAKRLANQVLASRIRVMSGFSWYGKQIQLICPQDDFATEEERRSYLEVVRIIQELVSIFYFNQCAIIGAHPNLTLPTIIADWR